METLSTDEHIDGRHHEIVGAAIMVLHSRDSHARQHGISWYVAMLNSAPAALLHIDYLQIITRYRDLDFCRFCWMSCSLVNDSQ